MTFASFVAAVPLEEPAAPAPQLVHLEQSLTRKQEARDKGELSPEKYGEFVSTFRGELDAVMARIPPTPESRGLHAQILARLGEEERGPALASLEQALVMTPENPALLISKGSILYEQKDYPAAAESARQAWEASGRADKRAWTLLKMSEGRSAGQKSGEAAPPLKPAADFARLEWTIPENNEVNPRAMGHVRQAIAARRSGDMAATVKAAQAAMSADPASAAVQKLYGLVQADQARHAETTAFIRQTVESLQAGRGAEAVAWARKAYDRSPSDDTYGILQDVQRRSAELGVERAARPPAKAPASQGSSPLLPALIVTGSGLAALGAFQVAKSKSARVSDDGVDPTPHVSPEQARRNYANSAVLIGAPILAAGLVYGGPLAWRAAAPAVSAVLRGGHESLQRLAASEAGAINPSGIAGVNSAPQGGVGEVVRQEILKKGTILNRGWHSEWTGDSRVLSGPYGASYCRGSCLPINATSALQRRGLAEIPGAAVNNSQRGALFKVKEDIVVLVRRAIGGVDEEIVVQKTDINKLELMAETVSKIPPGK